MACAICGTPLAGGVIRCALHRRPSEYGSGADPYRRHSTETEWPSQRDEAAGEALEERRVREIVGAVRALGRAGAPAIAARLGLGRSTVIEWLAVCVRRGRLTRIQVGPQVHYEEA